MASRTRRYCLMENHPDRRNAAQHRQSRRMARLAQGWRGWRMRTEGRGANKESSTAASSYMCDDKQTSTSTVEHRRREHSRTSTYEQQGSRTVRTSKKGIE
jgi:hypothetical protein